MNSCNYYFQTTWYFIGRLSYQAPNICGGHAIKNCLINAILSIQITILNKINQNFIFDSWSAGKQGNSGCRR